MKTLILLLFPLFASAQFTEAQIDKIYDRVKQGEYCAEDLIQCKKVALEYQTEFKIAAEKIRKSADTIDSQNILIEQLQAKKDEIKPAKRKYVTFGVGVFVGPDFKPIMGVGAVYNILSF